MATYTNATLTRGTNGIPTTLSSSDKVNWDLVSEQHHVAAGQEAAFEILQGGDRYFVVDTTNGVVSFGKSVKLEDSVPLVLGTGSEASLYLNPDVMGDASGLSALFLDPSGTDLGLVVRGPVYMVGGPGSPMPLGDTGALSIIFSSSVAGNGPTGVKVDIENDAGTALTSGGVSGVQIRITGNAGDTADSRYTGVDIGDVNSSGGAASYTGIHIGQGFHTGLHVRSGGVQVDAGGLAVEDSDIVVTNGSIQSDFATHLGVVLTPTDQAQSNSSLWVNDAGDLYFQNSSGTQIQITDGDDLLTGEGGDDGEFLPATMRLVASENIGVGDVVVIVGSARCSKGKAEDHHHVAGIAAGSALAMEYVDVYCVPGTVCPVSTDLQAVPTGSVVYLDEAVGGGLTNVPPSTAGSKVIRVGIVVDNMSSPNTILFQPQFMYEVA